MPLEQRSYRIRIPSLMLLAVFLYTLLHGVVPHSHHTHSSEDSHSVSIEHEHVSNHSHNHDHDSDQEKESGFLSIFIEHHSHELDQHYSFFFVSKKGVETGKKFDCSLPSIIPVLQERQDVQSVCSADYRNGRDYKSILVNCTPLRGPPSLV